MERIIETDVPTIKDANTIEIPTDADTELYLHLILTKIRDYRGERMGDYQIGINLIQDTDADDDGQLITMMSSAQIGVLIEQLSKLRNKVDQLNRIINE
nr:unnamed protein product [uncultured bacterium]